MHWKVLDMIMASSPPAVLTVRYLNGTEKKYEIAPARDEFTTLGSYLKEALAAKNMVLELPDKLLIIPFDNVQEIELAPVPPRVPGYVVKNVKSI